jgi:hypothetical protein
MLFSERHVERRRLRKKRTMTMMTMTTSPGLDSTTMTTMMMMMTRTKNHVNVQSVSDPLERRHQLASVQFVERKAMINR